MMCVPDLEIRYRPTCLSEFVFPSKRCQDEVNNWVDALNSSPLLLHGCNGTGKSSLARLLYFQLYPDITPPGDIVIIDADSRNDTVSKLRQIRKVSETMSFIFGCKRVVIIDEIDNYPTAVQKSLKGIFDRYKPFVHYILTTNHLGKVRSGLQSRSHLVLVGPANRQGWLEKSKWIFEMEGFTAPCDADLLNLVDLAHGDCRKILQRLSIIINQAKRSHVAGMERLASNVNLPVPTK